MYVLFTFEKPSRDRAVAKVMRGRQDRAVLARKDAAGARTSLVLPRATVQNYFKAGKEAIDTSFQLLVGRDWPGPGLRPTSSQDLASVDEVQQPCRDGVTRSIADSETFTCDPRCGPLRRGRARSLNRCVGLRRLGGTLHISLAGGIRARNRVSSLWPGHRVFWSESGRLKHGRGL